MVVSLQTFTFALAHSDILPHFVHCHTHIDSGSEDQPMVTPKGPSWLNKDCSVLFPARQSTLVVDLQTVC